MVSTFVSVFSTLHELTSLYLRMQHPFNTISDLEATDQSPLLLTRGGIPRKGLTAKCVPILRQFHRGKYPPFCNRILVYGFQLASTPRITVPPGMRLVNRFLFGSGVAPGTEIRVPGAILL